MIDENHIRELVERHTYEHNGVRYQVAFRRARFDLLSQAGVVEPRSVDLDFTATPVSGGDVINLTLHLGIDRAADDEFLLDAIDDTIRKIAAGDLPPGTRDLL